jgi:hypothetical protein
MSYLPSKTCFQSLRFTHCMPASLLSAPPPLPPPSRLYIPQPGLHQKYVALPFILRPTDSSVSTHVSLSSFLSSAWPFFSKSFWPRSCLGLAAVTPSPHLIPPYLPLILPPPNQVFLTISSVLFSLLSLLYSSCPIPHTTTADPCGVYYSVFLASARRWTIHVLRSRHFLPEYSHQCPALQSRGKSSVVFGVSCFSHCCRYLVFAC